MAIKPGWKEGTRVIFEGKGDRLPGRPPQDVVFVIKQVPHPRFTRQGDDLITEVTARQPLQTLTWTEMVAIREAGVKLEFLSVECRRRLQVSHPCVEILL